MGMLEQIWTALDGDDDLLDRVSVHGPTAVLPSGFRLTELAGASIAAATLAVAELAAARRGGLTPTVTVDRRHAAVAFGCEARQRAIGWTMPEVWDPLAGDYACADGWIRLHTNYEHHRLAVLRALNVGPDREQIAAVVARRGADEVEQLVVDADGCAAAMRTLDQWSSSAPGRAVAAEPLVRWTRNASGGQLPPPAGQPLAGIRVLDLTRVLAGPIATRLLAAYGADVLRVDPPGFAEVPAVLPETTLGKRRAVVDLGDRTVFAALLASAHVVVIGTRPEASIGVGSEWMRSINPDLVISRHDAYGWSGPWSRRRGFDSLVQMSTGIAADQMRRLGRERPTPLAAQALDHATGYLIAAGVCRALVGRIRDGEVSELQTSLARTAQLLIDAGPVEHFDVTPPTDVADLTERAQTAWGPVDRVRVPGTIVGVHPQFVRAAGPLGSDPPGWD